MKISRLLTTATLLALSYSGVAAADFGFCTDDLSRTNVFRLGDTETQGMAIRLDADKVAQLKGCTITGISAAFGSKRTTDGTAKVFIATDLEASPIVAADVAIADIVKFTTLALPTPYVITGDEPELYIGYTAEINTRSSMLLSDRQTPLAGCNYFYNNGKWDDAASLTFGNASLRVIVPDAPAITDVTIKPLALDGYFRTGETCNFRGEVFNSGTETVTAIDLEVSVDGAAPVKKSYTGLSVAPATAYAFDIPAFSASSEGYMPLNITVSNVVSANGSDVALSDNVFDTEMFFYPEHMERSILLEGFTGQDCHNCPSGHATINDFLESGLTTPVIEIMHHSGYQPDNMTMDSDIDYLFFYSGGSTFAPAFMINRMAVPSVNTVPASNVTPANLQAAYTAAENVEPYISLGIESTFDPATRTVKVDVSALTHKDLPAQLNVLNVVLVQDGIVANQTPVGSYTHNAVFRGAITGNSWGLSLSDESAAAGGKASWSHTFTLPEKIFSDYYNYLLDNPAITDPSAIIDYYSVPAVAENMKIVAYVGAFDAADNTKNVIYNAVEVPLGKTYAQGGMNTLGVDSVVADSGDGTYTVYNLFGVKVMQTTDAQNLRNLAPGIYIVNGRKYLVR